MTKIERYNGPLPAFARDYENQERTTFGETTESDSLNDNINTNFIRGWGIVGPNEFPTLQDFNAVNYTLGRVLAYLHQMGVAEWNSTQDYYISSIVTKNGKTYISQAGTDASPNTGNDPELDDGTNWKHYIAYGDNVQSTSHYSSLQASLESLDTKKTILYATQDDTLSSLATGDYSGITLQVFPGVTITVDIPTVDFNISAEDGGQVLYDQSTTDQNGWIESKGNTSGVVPFVGVTGDETLTCNNEVIAGYHQVFDPGTLSVTGLKESYPEWFGATPHDTSIDSTTAIQACNDSLDSDGVQIWSAPYGAKNLTITKNIFQYPNSYIRHFSNTGVTITITSAIRANKIEVDAIDTDGTTKLYGGLIYNQDFITSIGEIILHNLGAPDVSSTSIFGYQSDKASQVNKIQINGFENTGHSNASMPQAYKPGSVGDWVGTVKVKNAACSVYGTSNTSQVEIDMLDIFNCTDNGLYGSFGQLNIGQMKYHGQEEGITCSGNLKIGQLDIGEGLAAVNMQSGSLFIDSYNLVRGLRNGTFPEVHPLSCRPGADITEIYIGQINGEFFNDLFSYMGEANSIGKISINGGNVVCHGKGTGVGFFSDWSKAEQFNIENLTFYFIDEGAEADNYIQWQTSPTKTSKIKDLHFYSLDTNGNIINLPSLRLSGCFNGNTEISGVPLRQSPGLMVRGIFDSTLPNVVEDSLPLSSGTWKAGQFFYTASPAEGTPLGYLCVSGGTPGTWVPFGSVESSNSYTISGVSADRTHDADNTTQGQIADVLGTLILDLQNAGILK